MTFRLVGPWNVHDARVIAVSREPERCGVVLEAYEGDRLEFEFNGVIEIVGVQPLGMILYSIVEDPPESWRFVFVNWDEEDPRKLEITADRCRWRRAGESSWNEG